MMLAASSPEHLEHLFVYSWNPPRENSQDREWFGERLWEKNCLFSPNTNSHGIMNSTAIMMMIGRAGLGLASKIPMTRVQETTDVSVFWAAQYNFMIIIYF